MGIRILVRAVASTPSPRRQSSSFAKVKTSVSVRDGKKEAFPSEYSFAIRPISLAFLTEPEGDKKIKKIPPLTGVALVYLPNFRVYLCNQTQPTIPATLAFGFLFCFIQIYRLVIYFSRLLLLLQYRSIVR